MNSTFTDRTGDRTGGFHRKISLFKKYFGSSPEVVGKKP
jgi:hypothetical protein